MWASAKWVAPAYTLREYLFARFFASVARHETVDLRSYASKQTKIYLPREQNALYVHSVIIRIYNFYLTYLTKSLLNVLGT